MFCYQCQETARNQGCTVKGVCGKTAEVAGLQDLLLFLLKGISHRTTALRAVGLKVAPQVNRFVTESLFMTITNANFDEERFSTRIREAIAVRDSLVSVETTQPECECLSWKGGSADEFRQMTARTGILQAGDEDVRSLRQLLTYGIKGMAAYVEHASRLGYEDDSVHAFIQQALVATTQELSVGDLVGWVLRCGEYGVKTMAMLDQANTATFGNPEITKVETGVRTNPAILVSGHDLRDLQELLEQTRDTGVDVYTHSEMLPAHYYPAFKKYTHFAGNYGSSWWHQHEDFSSFNGVILFTTNCIVPPRRDATYAGRVYTTGAAGFPGFKHIGERKDGSGKDFSELIGHVRRCEPPVQIEAGQITGGFAHAQVFALADKIVGAVQSGAIRKFIVMAGCDGRMKERGYYTEFAEKLPADTVILTAGCAKYRYNKLPLGEIGGIPRVLDAGQCNDSYSLALIALKLKEVFGLDDINRLPIVYNIAWYEQKAVIVLLALLSLGVKNIHLGPTLPAFLSPNVTKVLAENFGISGITDADSDLKKMIG